MTAIAVDRDGNAYLTGSTRASDFPVTTGAYETVFKPYTEPGFLPRSGTPFVTKLNQNGSALVYSTFLSGTQTLGANDIALDSAGNAYIASGGYISKLDPSGSALRFSEYFRAGWLPDYEPDFRTGWLALDSSENLYSSGGATGEASQKYGALLRDHRGFPNTLGQPYKALKQRFHSLLPAGRPISTWTEWLVLYFGTHADQLGSFKRAAGNRIQGNCGRWQRDGSHHSWARNTTDFPRRDGFSKLLGIPVPTSGDGLGSLIIRAPKKGVGLCRPYRRTRTGPGRAGLAYSTQPVAQALTEPVFLAGLRQNATDRSNCALLNVGSPADGDVVLRITVYPPSPSTFAAPGLFEERLVPGEV